MNTQFLIAVSSPGEITVLILSALSALVFGIAALYAILKIPALLRAQRATNRILALLALKRGVNKDEVLSAWEAGS